MRFGGDVSLFCPRGLGEVDPLALRGERVTQMWLLSVVHFPGPSDETAPDNSDGSARTLGACLVTGAAEKVHPAGPCWEEPVEVGGAGGVGGASGGGRSRMALHPQATCWLLNQTVPEDGTLKFLVV